MDFVSLSTSFDYNIPIALQIGMIKNNGFTHISFGGNYDHSGIIDNNKIINVIKLLDDNDLGVDTIHGYILDKPDSLEINKKIVNSSIILKVPIIVLHCSSFIIKNDTFEDRKKDIMKKIPVLKSWYEKYGVKFAFENLMPGITTDLTRFVLDVTDQNIFGFCYDSSHDQIDGPNSFDLLMDYKERLFTVHISDRIKEFVDHVIPGEGFIDFNSICKIIGESKYDSPLLMEVMMEHSKYKDKNVFLNKAYENAKEINRKIKEYRIKKV